MLSVTQRVRTVSQPSNGFVPLSLFKTSTFDDALVVLDVKPSLASIQGLAVDYLTRFMLSKDVYKAFDIPLKGAKILAEIKGNMDTYKDARSLVSNINGLDALSVKSTCKVVCYDSIVRSGIKSYIDHNNIEFDDAILKNIPILVKRCLSFFDTVVDKLICDGFTFEGGYTDLVSSGDGDYLTESMIIDLKVSKNNMSAKWSLQLLMYYLLGIHSVHREFENIKQLCIFNPCKNQSYVCNIDDISNEIKYKVSHDVLGYKMTIHEDYSSWMRVDGSDKEMVRIFLNAQFVSTDFNASNFDDGIFDITVDDYWTYLKTFEEYAGTLRPRFKHTASVKFMKHNGYIMFVSVSHKGKLSLLHGARLHSLNRPLEYYYNNMERYAIAIIAHFEKYWNALDTISTQVQSLQPSEQYIKQQYAVYISSQKYLGHSESEWMSLDEWIQFSGGYYRLSGKIHGCIVDIDWNNHIYLNPYDGTVVPYYAKSMYDKDVYKNTRSLLSDKRPEMLPSFDNMVKQLDGSQENFLLACDGSNKNLLLIPQDDTISTEIVKVYEYDMYGISNKLKPLRNIYDNKLIQVWYNEVLNKLPTVPCILQ